MNHYSYSVSVINLGHLAAKNLWPRKIWQTWCKSSWMWPPVCNRGRQRNPADFRWKETSKESNCFKLRNDSLLHLVQLSFLPPQWLLRLGSFGPCWEWCWGCFVLRVNSKYGRLVQEIRPHQHVKTSCLWCQFHQRIFHKACQRGPGSKAYAKDQKGHATADMLWNQVCHTWLVHFVLVFARSLSMLFRPSPTMGFQSGTADVQSSGTVLKFLPPPQADSSEARRVVDFQNQQNRKGTLMHWIIRILTGKVLHRYRRQTMIRVSRPPHCFQKYFSDH